MEKTLKRKSNLVACVLVLIVVCVGIVLAGDVVVKEGDVDANNVTVTDDLTVGGDLSVDEDLTVAVNAGIGGDLDVSGDITAMGATITIVGPELLDDPAFDDPNAWTDPGSCWTVSGGIASACSGPGFSLTEVNPFTVKANTTYLVQIYVGISFSDLTISLGGVTTETFRSGRHTFSIETTNTNSLALTKETGGGPCIVVEMSVKEGGTASAELGDTGISGKLYVTSDADVYNLTARNCVTAGWNISADHDITAGADLTVTDDLIVGGNTAITGTVRTTSGDVWDLNDYTTDANASSAGYVTVTINGTEYRLLAAPAP